MASINFGEFCKKKTTGVWLKYEVNCDLRQIIDKNPNKGCFDTVSRIIVSDYEDRDIWVQVWCKNLWDTVIWKKHRYNVFYIKIKNIDVNDDWSCYVF